MIEVPAFADGVDCRAVIAAYEWCVAGHSHKIGDGFFDHRVLWINSLPKSENSARRVLQGWRHRAVEIASRSARTPLYSDTVQVVRWDGQEMPPHLDNRNPDGSPHNTPWREWAGIVYVNDDFEGGEINAPETGASYKPAVGAFLFFPC